MFTPVALTIVFALSGSLVLSVDGDPGSRLLFAERRVS